MRATITGGRGAAGSYLSEYLKSQGDAVSIIARPQCDLLSLNSLCGHLEEYRPDIIYHLAADADVRESFDIPYTVMHNNIMGTVNLFKACVRLNLKPVIQVCSTSEVYGTPATWPIDETFPLNPVNPYAVSKTVQDLYGAMCEKIHGLQVVRTRAFGYVNPRRENLALTAFARQIVQIEKGELSELRHGNLDSVRTFCDVRDICKAYRAAAPLSGAFNIGSEAAITVRVALDFLCRQARTSIRLVQDSALMRPTDVTNQIPDCRKFRAATGWQPTIPLEDSLAWLLSTCRDSH